jgi:two-component system, sensor histidine kinase and response regulator
MGDSTNAASILVVDDEAAHVRALCDTLQDNGYSVTGVCDGNSALAVLRGHRFDVVLTDLMMPGVDGIALLRAALERDPDLVCIMMTGHGTIDSAVDAMKTGALDYILKPFKVPEILATVSRALAVRRLRLEKVALERGLRERTEELEVANQDLEAFAHSVSHDLRAPLRAVDGFAMLLEADAAALFNDEQRHFLRTIRDGVSQATGIIEALLRFARLGRQTLTKTAVDMDALAEQVLADLRNLDSSRQVEVRKDALPACFGDPDLLRHVLTNLLSNAFKFTAKQPEARVEIGSQEIAGQTVYYVRDNGAGFDTKYASRLFMVFERLHSAQEFEGSGVGLSIVKRILDRHGGQIRAESEVGKGTTFHFTVGAFR